MKIKAIFPLITVILICGCTSTETHTANIGNRQIHDSLDYIKSNEYAFYLDKRYPEHFYRGYMRVSFNNYNSVIIVRNINVNTSKEERFIFIITDDEYGYPTVIQNIQGQFSKMEIRQAIPDFINFTSSYLRTQNDYETVSEINDEWDDFTLVFSFDKSLPFFKFSDVKLKGDDESNYTLEHGGLINSTNFFEEYFKMNPFRNN